MSNIIYLYLKTHNKTGLKYLGKTEQDPLKYRGSGVYWLRHLEKHGNDVSTEILFETTDLNEFEKIGLEYSKKWNIVESKEFANLIDESGTGGNTSNCREYKSMSEESKQKLAESKKGQVPWNKGKKGYKMSKNKNPMSEETKKKLSDSVKRYWAEKKLSQS